MKQALPISALLEAMAESLSPSDIVASTTKAQVAHQITIWRIDHGMTQMQFAEYCGVTQATISKWENGDFNFTLDKLAEIACKLDMKLEISLAPTASTSPIDRFSDEYSSISQRMEQTMSAMSGYHKKVVPIASAKQYTGGRGSSITYEELKEE